MARVLYDHVYKRWGNIEAVSDLTIDIEDKEFLVFVGPSGCGKSTSLRMLAGLEEVSDGRIIIGDRVVNNVAPKDRDIAMVFQSYALYPHMTVYDNMAFGLRLRKVPKQVIDEKVREAAGSLGIENLLDRRPRQLSGGQRQRVAVGRAIVRDPEVFLMDEPLSNLDAKLRVEARSFISRLHQRLGTTFIYVTHDQVEAMTMGTRIAVLNAGKLQQIDSPSNLYSHPSNQFVAGFIGSPSMNFFDAMLTEEDGKIKVDIGFALLDIPEAYYDRSRPHLGNQVVFGIRPDDIHNHEFQPSDITPALVEAEVDVIELMGHEKVVYLKNNGTTYLARMDPRSDVHIGLNTGAVFNLANMHLFDKQTGESMLKDAQINLRAKAEA